MDAYISQQPERFNFDRYPPPLTGRTQWMCHSDKHPVAPWADPDAPAPCSTHNTTADECECDARWKWGYRANWADFETALGWAEEERYDGVVFLQTEDDPFCYVDGDDVRDPDSGEIHPGFVAILNHLGATYTDVSQSHSGIHAIYRGDLPVGTKQASWRLDDEPWGGNDDLPSVEIYPGKRVNVMTGLHIKSAPVSVSGFEPGVIVPMIEANGCHNATSDHDSDFDLDDYSPDATDADETADDIRDIYAAIDRLDARDVAGKTIVHEWNDGASTSSGEKAFKPTWGPNSNGTANIVNEDRWMDSGDGGGYGGPVTMAAIDANEISHRNASPVSGLTWWQGVDHLRELGYPIPELSETANQRMAYENWVSEVRGQNTMLHADEVPWDVVQHLVEEHDLSDPSNGGKGGWASYRAACRILMVTEDIDIIFGDN